MVPWILVVEWIWIYIYISLYLILRGVKLIKLFILVLFCINKELVEYKQYKLLNCNFAVWHVVCAHKLTFWYYTLEDKLHNSVVWFSNFSNESVTPLNLRNMTLSVRLLISVQKIKQENEFKTFLNFMRVIDTSDKVQSSRGFFR